VSELEEFKLFTELLNKLHESGFVVSKAKYDLLNMHMAGFEIHATYKEGNVTWFFVFECSLSGACKVKEEDVDVEVVLNNQSVYAIIDTALNMTTYIANALKDMRLLAEKIRQMLGEDTIFKNLKTKILLSKDYGEIQLNHGTLQIVLQPRNVKIDVEISLENWDEAKLLTLIKHLNDALQLEGFKNQVS
jgi:hypothetical protein